MNIDRRARGGGRGCVNENVHVRKGRARSKTLNLEIKFVFVELSSDLLSALDKVLSFSQ